MEFEKQTEKRKSGRSFLLAGGVIVVVLVIAYLMFLYPTPKQEETRGTLANVEKAERYQGKQMSRDEILQAHPQVDSLIQSAAWQNAIKDPQFVALIQDKNYQKLVLNQDYQKLASTLVAAGCWQNDAVRKLMSDAVFTKMIYSQQMLDNVDEKQVKGLFSADFAKFVEHDSVQQILKGYGQDQAIPKKLKEKALKVFGNDFGNLFDQAVVIDFLAGPDCKAIMGVILWAQENKMDVGYYIAMIYNYAGQVQSAVERTALVNAIVYTARNDLDAISALCFANDTDNAAKLDFIANLDALVYGYAIVE